MTMNVNEMTKQVMDFQKGAFSSWCDTMAVMQDRTASAMDMIFSQAGWIPDKGRKAILSWLSACMKEHDRFKVYVQDSFSNLEKYFSQELTICQARHPKPAAKAKTAVRRVESKAAAVEGRAAAAEIKPEPAAVAEMKTGDLTKPDASVVDEKKAAAEIKPKAAAAEEKNAPVVIKADTDIVEEKKAAGAKKQKAAAARETKQSIQ